MIQNAERRPIADVTVAISTRDRADALVRCVDSLLAGSVLPREIIIVDQSRDERTRSTLENCHGGIVSIVCIRHNGTGLGASQNIAVANASSPIVAVIDDDCIATPDWIGTIERTFSVPECPDVLTGRVLPLGPNKPGLYAVSSRTSTQRIEFERRAMPWEIGSGNNFATSRNWFNRVGGNDERLGPGSAGLGGVDMDLFYRLLRSGARIHL